MPKRKAARYYNVAHERKRRRDGPERARLRVIAIRQAASEQSIARTEQMEATLGVSNTQRDSRLFSRLPIEIRKAIFGLVLEDKPCPNPVARRVWCCPHHRVVGWPSEHRSPPGWRADHHRELPQPWCTCVDCANGLEYDQFGNVPGRVNITTEGRVPILFSFRRCQSLSLLRACKRTYAEGIPILYGSNRTWSFITNPDSLLLRTVPVPPSYYDEAAPIWPIRAASQFLTHIGGVALTFLENVSITLYKVLDRSHYTMPGSAERVFAQLKTCTRLRRITFQLCLHYHRLTVMSRSERIRKMGSFVATVTMPGHVEDMVDIANRFWAKNDGHIKQWAIPIGPNQEEKHSTCYSATFGNVEVRINLSTSNKEMIASLQQRTFYQEGREAS